jgi:hypothetical protein
MNGSDSATNNREVPYFKTKKAYFHKKPYLTREELQYFHKKIILIFTQKYPYFNQRGPIFTQKYSLKKYRTDRELKAVNEKGKNLGKTLSNCSIVKG